MLTEKKVAHGMTYGLGEAGYDIRIKQEIRFTKVIGESGLVERRVQVFDDGKLVSTKDGSFTIASAIEYFQMPPVLLGRVCDKSSWARKGLGVFNTVIEPGWNGFLTLELIYHGQHDLTIPAGAPIAQVLFEEVMVPTYYNGRYQDQKNEPTKAKEAK